MGLSFHPADNFPVLVLAFGKGEGFIHQIIHMTSLLDDMVLCTFLGCKSFTGVLHFFEFIFRNCSSRNGDEDRSKVHAEIHLREAEPSSVASHKSEIVAKGQKRASGKGMSGDCRNGNHGIR